LGFFIESNKGNKLTMPFKYTSNIKLLVGGKMNEKDAGTVGKLLAISVLILSAGLSIAATIWAASHLFHSLVN
jgi:hypothetical protein